MRALVVYESIFGNTRSVALAIADGLGKVLDVEAVEVSEAPPALPSDLDILVIGGPTHAHGLTSPKSRASGAERAALLRLELLFQDLVAGCASYGELTDAVRHRLADVRGSGYAA